MTDEPKVGFETQEERGLQVACLKKWIDEQTSMCGVYSENEDLPNCAEWNIAYNLALIAKAIILTSGYLQKLE